MRRVRKFRELSLEEKLLFSEAYFLHLTAGLILKVIPFRWIPRVFSSRQSSVFSLQSKRIEVIKVAIQRAGRVSPWKNRCLVSSLAGRCMLRRREISSRLYFGVSKNADGRTIAHSWLKACNLELVPRGADFIEMYSF